MFNSEIKNGRVGLAVADMQTFHRGHNGLLNEIRMTCDRGIIGLGSVNKFGVHGHPFTYEQRKEMISAIHGDFFDFVPLHDIDASFDVRDWYSYAEKKIADAGLPQPTDYFSGSRIDAKWYFHAFADESHPTVSHGTTTIFSNPFTKKRLHVLNRELGGLPSGREVRLLIETRDLEWKRYVPSRLHGYVDWNYPSHLRQYLKAKDALSWSIITHAFNKTLEADMNDVGKYPVGTRLGGEVHNNELEKAKALGWQVTTDHWGSYIIVLELKDDGKWRPIHTEDEKEIWAQQALQKTVI